MKNAVAEFKRVCGFREAQIKTNVKDAPFQNSAGQSTIPGIQSSPAGLCMRLWSPRRRAFAEDKAATKQQQPGKLANAAQKDADADRTVMREKARGRFD